jgi:hypothetical protein
MYRGKTISLNNFGGGLASNLATTTHTINQASDLDNIVLFDGGLGFRKRFGNTEFNGTAMNGGATVQGLGYYKTNASAEYLLAVAGTKLYKSTSLSGTMDDITGSLTLTAGNNNHFTFVVYNNVIMGFGGNPTSPDAPFSWNASGNAAALAGSPPSAYGAFQVNNRVFAYRTSSNPSRIYWSIVGNQADWTGTGSGSSDVSLSDNDKIAAHAVLNNNTVLLFKENSVHQMVVTNLVSGAFPIFPLFSDTGCIGKGAVVTVKGLVYYITPNGRMRVTDGHQIIDEEAIPALGNINDKWSALSSSRFPFIQGIYYEGTDCEHIIWLVSSSGSSTNDKAFVWDLRNKCWLQNTTGYAMNCMAKTQAGTLYAGGYNGKVYKQDSASTVVTDASNSSAAVVGYWTSGWLSEGTFEGIKQIRQLTTSFKTQDTGSFDVSYGYDFNSFQNTFSISQQSPGARFDISLFDTAGDVFGVQSDLLRPGQRFAGRGNVFQFRIRGSQAVNTTINSLMFSGKEYGQKVIGAK